MRRALGAFLKGLAVVIAAAPFALTAFLYFGSATSLAIVAPGGVWMLAAVFIVPILLGIAIWRLSARVR